MGRRERESKKKRKERKHEKRGKKGKGQLKRVGEWSVGWLGPMVGVTGRTLVFFEAPGAVTGLFHEVAGDPPLDVVAEFHVACTDPIALEPRRPQRLRTEDEQLATILSTVPELTVTVGPTPEIGTLAERVRRDLARQKAPAHEDHSDGEVEDGEVEDGEVEDGLEESEASADYDDEYADAELLLPEGLPEDAIRRFYRAAVALDDAKLWACVRDGKILEARLEGEETPRFVLPLHGDGEAQAVLLFHSRADADAYDRDYWGELVAPMASLTMIYEPLDALTEEGQAKLQAWHGGMAGAEAVPVFKRFEAGHGPPLDPTASDVRLMTAALVGLRALFAEHAEVLANARGGSVTLRTRAAAPDEQGAEFVLPPWDGEPADYATFDEDEDEDEDGDQDSAPTDPELEAALTRLSTVGRNSPCPCGSNKKYKKCHFVDDQNRRLGVGMGPVPL